MLPAHPVGAIAAVFGVMLSLASVGNFVRFFQEYFSDKAAILAVNDIRRQLYDHVLHIPVGLLRPAGARATSPAGSCRTAQGCRTASRRCSARRIQEPIKAAFAFGLALWFDWQLTLFIVLFGPLMFAIIKKFGKKMRRASRKALQIVGDACSGRSRRTLVGIRVVKARRRRAVRAAAVHADHGRAGRRAAQDEPDRRDQHADDGDADAAGRRRGSCCSRRTWCW